MAILAPLDMDDLLATGLASPPNSTGTRRIHKRRLNRWSDTDNSDIPLVHVSSPQAQAQQAFVDIPDELISLATLRYIGYREDTASMLWERWNHWPPGEPVREVDDDVGGMPFIEFAIGYIQGPHRDTWEENDQAWRTCMNSLGVSDELQDAILDPIFREIRLGDSCVFWVVDSMQMRYRGLEEIQQTSREREMAIKRASTRPDSGSASGQRASSSSIPPRTHL